MFLVTMIPALLLNRFIGSNYYFVNGPVSGTLTGQLAEWVGEDAYLLPMVGMLAVNGLTSNPLAEAFGAMREGACVSAVVYGDPDAFKPDDPEDFFFVRVGSTSISSLMPMKLS